MPTPFKFLVVGSPGYEEVRVVVGDGECVLWDEKYPRGEPISLGIKGKMTKETARALVPFIQYFAEHGHIPEKWPNPNPYPPKDRSKTRTELKILSHRWRPDNHLGDELYYLVEIPEAKVRLWTQATNLPEWVRQASVRTWRSFSVEVNLKGTNWAELAPEAWGWGY